MCFCRGDGEKYPEACPVYEGEKHGQGHMTTLAEANAYRGDKNTTRFGFSCQKWTEYGQEDANWEGNFFAAPRRARPVHEADEPGERRRGGHK